MLGKRPRPIPSAPSAPSFSSSPHLLHSPLLHRLPLYLTPSSSSSSAPRHIVIGFDLSPDSSSPSPPPLPDLACNSKLSLDCCESPRSVLDAICAPPKPCIPRSPLFSLLYGKKDGHHDGVGIAVYDILGVQEEDSNTTDGPHGFGPTSASNYDPSSDDVVVQETIHLQCSPSSSAWSPSPEGCFQVASELLDAAEREAAVVPKRGYSSMFAASSPPPCGSFEKPSMLFLSEYCCFCNAPLHGKDIFMYRGDQAFCSMECRCQQILIDEGAARMN